MTTPEPRPLKGDELQDLVRNLAKAEGVTEQEAAALLVTALANDAPPLRTSGP